MNVYFGKIAPKNKEQIDNLYYKAPQTWTGFNGLSDGDYVYMMCQGIVHLWKAKPYDTANGWRPFECVLSQIGDCTAFLAHIKYFKLTMDLAVKSHRQTKGMAFFKLDVDPSFSEEKIVDPQTYKDSETFRNVVIREDKDSVDPDSYDLQFYFEEGSLKCESPKFSDESYYKDFRDNLPLIGGNRPKKDKILTIIKDDANIDKEFDFNSELDLLKVYDAFMVDYKAKDCAVDDETKFWCFNHNYNGCGADGFKKFKEWAFENKSCKMQQEFEVDKQNVKQNWQRACSIKPGDVIFLRAGDYAYAYGFAIEPRKKGKVKNFVEVSAQDIIKKKSSGTYCSSKEYKDYVFFNDADVFYEDFSDGTWGQRVDVDEWYVPEDCVSVKVLDKTLFKDKHPYLTIREMAPEEAKKIMETLGYEEDLNTFDDCMIPRRNLLEIKKNIILQGAPGTGKTYATAALALSVLGISDVDLNDHDAVMKRYNSLLISFDDNGYVKNNGQIGFVTFHQSMDYEDFVEGIKPQISNGAENTQVKYVVLPGIFKSIVTEAKFAYVDSKNLEAKSVEIFDQKWTKLIDWANEEIFKSGFGCLQTKNETTMKILEATDGMVKMQGESALNTTISYRSEVKKLWDVFGTVELDKIDNFNKEFRKYVGGNCTSKYAILKKLQEISAVVSDSIQLDSCLSQKKDDLINLLKNDDYKKSDVKKFVLIIDEINRGNVSKIFGELISLLETDKRDGSSHPLTVTLPYSKDSFSIPSNLYIIGTMNTTDRSVGSIDYAVRRRFAFVTLEADENKVPEGDARSLFKAVKYFLEMSKYDMDIEDLMVGHSYFMDANNLSMKWQYEILPLLMEYHRDGIIGMSPLKDPAGKDIAEVKKSYANFMSTWIKKEPNTTEQ